MSRNKEHRGAAFGGDPNGAVASRKLHWECVHKYLWIFLIYAVCVPYIFSRYVPSIFLCVFLNLWSQE